MDSLIHETINELVFKNGHITINKLPLNWFEQGCNMVYWIAYVVKAYNILPTLVVNSDQIGVRLVPIVRKKNWENKGSKHIQVLEVEDKWQITVVISSVANDFLLPLHIMVIGIIHHCLPPFNEGKNKCMSSSWDLTFSENHWSTLKQQNNSSIRFCCHTRTFKFAT